MIAEELEAEVEAEEAVGEAPEAELEEEAAAAAAELEEEAAAAAEEEEEAAAAAEEEEKEEEKEEGGSKPREADSAGEIIGVGKLKF